MTERRRAVVKTMAVGISAGLFALAVAQAQPGCDAGSSDGAAPAAGGAGKAEKPVQAEEQAAPDPPPPPAQTPPRSADAPQVDDAIPPALAGPPDPAVPDADADASAGQPDPASPRNRRKPGKKKDPDTKVFLPATKSGAFLPPPQPQQANPPANQQ
jgi:hypothetical protein